MVREQESCLLIRELFSPALDQEISPPEQARLEQHLRECPECFREWQEWQEISAAVSNLAWDCPPPADFSQKVMQKISQEPPKRFWFRSWKALGGIAAGFALMLGSVGLALNYQGTSAPPPNPTVAVVEPQPSTPAPEITVEPAPVEEPSPGEEEIITPPEIVAPPETPKTEPSVENPPAPDNQVSSPEQPEEVPEEPVVSTPSVVAEEPNETPEAETVSAPVVLWSKSEIKLENTLLKLSASDLNATAGQVSSLAANYGAKVSTSSNSASVQTITVTIAKDQSASLLAGLSGLATVTSTNTETTDLTYRYKEAVSRYQELQSLIDNGNANGEQKVEYSTLEQQLQDWEAQDGKSVITVWIEKAY